MDLSKAHHFFHSRFRCLRGFDFQAQLLAAPLEESAVYFLVPRRILKLDHNSPVTSGDIIRSYTSDHMWLCGDNGPSEYRNRAIYKSLKLFEVTHRTASWKTLSRYEDEITGIKRKEEPRETAKIPVAIEFVKQQEDEMRIPADMLRIITASPVSIGDLVDEFTIINVEPQLGLYFCTAKRQ